MRLILRMFGFAVAAVLLLDGAAGTRVCGQAASKEPTPAVSRSEETLRAWNEIGNKLIAMAEDFPEEKYDYKLEKDERAFAQNILHVASVDYDLIGNVAGTHVGPDFGKDKHNPSRDVYKTKADVTKLIREAVAEGAKLIEQQGDAGLDATTKYAWGNRMVRHSYIWSVVIEHSAEHYGQLVVYYRANGLVPPDSRR
jgi:uncharacterized damage-inducible protein DinB